MQSPWCVPQGRLGRQDLTLPLTLAVAIKSGPLYTRANRLWQMSCRLQRALWWAVGGLSGIGWHIAGAWSWERQKPRSFIAEAVVHQHQKHNAWSWQDSHRRWSSSAGEGVEERKPLYTVDGSEVGTATMQSSTEDPQEIEDRTPERASNAPPGRVSRANESRILKPYLYPHTHGSISHSHQNTTT